MTKLIFLPHEEICPEGAIIESEPGVSICDAALAGALAHLAGEWALREQMRAHLLASRPAQDWPGVITATLGEYRRAAVALR